jgi:hypothetical protein
MMGMPCLLLEFSKWLSSNPLTGVVAQEDTTIISIIFESGQQSCDQIALLVFFRLFGVRFGAGALFCRG